MATATLWVMWDWGLSWDFSIVCFPASGVHGASMGSRGGVGGLSATQRQPQGLGLTADLGGLLRP